MASLDDAHAALLRDATLQFEFKASPPPPSKPFTFGFGGLTTVWAAVGLAVLVILVLVVNYLRNRPKALPSDKASKNAAGGAPAGGFAIPATAARLALSDADHLAAAGRFSDAAHVLLACGVDEIARRYPNALRPATTSRDIAGMDSLPDTMRRAFGRIAASVEIALFGGRAIDAADYADCRRAFVTTALAGGA